MANGKDRIVKLINWSDKAIDQLDKINATWIDITDRYNEYLKELKLK